MALLTRAGTVSIPLPATVPSLYTGTVSIGFRPKLIFFWWGTADPTGQAAVNEYGFGFGVRDDNSRPGLPPQFEGRWHQAMMTFRGPEGGSQQWAWSTAGVSGCISIAECVSTHHTEVFSGTVIPEADSFRFRCNVVRNNSPIHLNYLAIGGDDLQETGILQCLTPMINGAHSFTGLEFQPDALLIFGARGLSAQTGGCYPSLGFGNASKQACTCAALAFTYAGTPVSSSSKQSTTHILEYLSSTGNTTGKAELISLDPDGFTLDFSNMSAAAGTYFWAVGLKGIETDIIDFLQPTTGGTQDVATTVQQPAAVLLCSNGKEASASSSAHSTLAIGGTSGPGRQACVWTDSRNGVTPVDNFRVQNSYALQLWQVTDRTTPAASIDNITLAENNINLDWGSTISEPTQRHILGFVLGGGLVSSAPPYYCYDQARNGQFTYGLDHWTHDNAVLVSDHVCRLYAAYPTDNGYVEQTLTDLVEGSLINIFFDVVGVFPSGSMRVAYQLLYNNGGIEEVLATNFTYTTGSRKSLSTFVPIGGTITLRITASCLSSTYSGHVDIDNVVIDACSYLSSSSVIIDSSSSSESLYWCYDQLINGDFSQGMLAWASYQAYIAFPGRVRITGYPSGDGYVSQTIESLVPATAGSLLFNIVTVSGTPAFQIKGLLRDAATNNIIAITTFTTVGIKEVGFIVPASGGVIAEIQAVTTHPTDPVFVDIDDCELNACSFLRSYSSVISSISSVSLSFPSESSYSVSESSLSSISLSSSSLSSSSSSSSLPVTDDCLALIGDSFARISVDGLGQTDGLSIDGTYSVGGGGIVWAGDAANDLSIVSDKVVRPIGAEWTGTLAYADAGAYNGTLTSVFILNDASDLIAAGYLIRVVDDTAYTHIHITPSRIQVITDGVTEIASATISPLLPRNVPLTAVITVNGNIATVGIYKYDGSQYAYMTFPAVHNETATRFGIRILNQAAGTFYDYFYFDNCAGYSSFFPSLSSSSLSSLSESSFSSISSSSLSFSSLSISSEVSSLISSSSSLEYISSSLIYDDIGREQIAVDQPQGGTRYPFIDPSDNLDLLIGDLHLRYSDRFCCLRQPFHIEWLYGFGTLLSANPTGSVHDFDMLIVDADDQVVFDSRDAYSFSIFQWSVSKWILEWVGSDDDILRVVLYRSWGPGEQPRNWPIYFEPDRSDLDPRATERAIATVQELRVGTSLTEDESDIVIPAGKNLILRAGYNMLFTPQSTVDIDGTRRVTDVILEAVPGEGLGQYPGCDTEPVLRRINSIEADKSGNLRVDAAECYRLERPIAEHDEASTGLVSPTTYTYVGDPREIRLQPATLKLSNDCGPCCECDDFINVYEGIRKVSRRYADLGRRAEIVRDLHHENIARWNEQKECRRKHLLQMALQPIGPCRLAVAAALCNGTNEPLLDVRLTLDFSGSTIAGCVVCYTTYRRGNVDPYRDIPPSRLMPYKLGGAWPVFTANFDCINEGENGYVTFVLQFNGCTSADRVTLTISAEAAGVANPGDSVPITASTGLIMYPDTGDCCEMGE